MRDKMPCPAHLIVLAALLSSFCVSNCFSQCSDTVYARIFSWGGEADEEGIHWDEATGGCYESICLAQRGCSPQYHQPSYTDGQPCLDQDTALFSYNYQYCSGDNYHCGNGHYYRYIRDFTEWGCECGKENREPCAPSFDRNNCMYTECAGFRPTNGLLGQIEIYPKPIAYENWLPSYGEEFDISITVTNKMNLEAVFKTSTYQGMAMNTDVPYGDEQVLDIVVMDYSGWDLDSTWMEGDRVCAKYLTHTTLSPGTALHFSFLMLDFGAEGDLYVRNCNDTTLLADQFPYQMPYNYPSLQITADADADGFTEWEENRGLIISGMHQRLNNNVGEAFIHGLPSSYASDMEVVTGFSVIDGSSVASIQAGGSGFPIRFVDFKSYLGVNNDLNPLCEPGITPPLAVDWADQGIIPGVSTGIILSDAYIWEIDPLTLDTIRTLGETTVSQPTNWYPGGGGIPRIVIYIGSINAAVASYVRIGILPVEYRGHVIEETTKRVYFHEMGHAYGLVDASDPVNRDCVMKYETAADILSYQNRWPEYAWGSGYTLCPGTPRLRP